MVFNLSGDGASAATTSDGIELSVAPRPGAEASYRGTGEECSTRNNTSGIPTGIYRLSIERVPALTTIGVAFLTSNGPEAGLWSLSGSKQYSDPDVLPYYGDGHYQVGTELRSVLVLLRCD
jgi:hypothetical protein